MGSDPCTLGGSTTETIARAEVDKRARKMKQTHRIVAEPERLLTHSDTRPASRWQRGRANENRKEQTVKVAVLKNPYAFAYVVSDVPEAGRSRLLDDLYWPVEHSFLKQYENGPDSEIIAGNFQKHGVASLEQLLKIQPAPWEQALSAVIEKLADTGIRGYIHGSAALSIWGIDVAPRNLDIIFPDLSDFDRIRQIFLNETIYPIERCDGWIMGGLGGLFAHANISIAFQNATDVPFDMSQLKVVEWMGREIAVSPLEWLKRDNLNYGRFERVELIERFLSKIGSQDTPATAPHSGQQ